MPGPDEVEVFSVTISQNRETGDMRVRVWEIVEETRDGDGPKGGSYREVSNNLLKNLRTQHRIVTTEKAA